MKREKSSFNRVFTNFSIFFVTAVFLLWSASVYAEGFSLSKNVDSAKAGYTLLLILVLAILLETGLSTLFNWRIFLQYCEAKGLKVPIAVLSAFFFVNQFDIDAVAEILSAFSETSFPHGIGGHILTALIIAGGSSAVFTLFEKLGIRNPIERRGVAESMKNQSRLKVKLLRVGEPNDKSASVLVDGEMVGVINANANDFGGFLGYIVKAGERKVLLKSRDKDGNEKIFEKEIRIAPGTTATETFKLTPDGFEA